jgi:Cu/Ag efflux protein CusF
MAPFAAVAQTEHAAHHGAAAAPNAQTAMTNGVVKKVDKAAGSVTIAHEPLTNLGMPAMTMTFLVQDRAWLNGMKEGAKIRFVASSVKGELTVVAVEQAK